MQLAASLQQALALCKAYSDGSGDMVSLVVPFAASCQPDR